ncbi:hypothetical protein GUJ93_ZPchr0004g38338 [Zizania palustris]|uniref:Uncharacterized protein n=1 Tax=Zizania palustris TaxID=103762 RepID=A0A8J5VNT0_ZIZPA|nr:hypothetical protein GUJ93_ZPchr0004g38338 [Zizania palustris]
MGTSTTSTSMGLSTPLDPVRSVDIDNRNIVVPTFADLSVEDRADIEAKMEILCPLLLGRFTKTCRGIAKHDIDVLDFSGSKDRK